MLQIHENVSLKNFNSFGIDAFARYFVEINHPVDLVELLVKGEALIADKLKFNLINSKNTEETTQLLILH